MTKSFTSDGPSELVLQQLQKYLRCSFKDIRLLQEALSHPSYVNENFGPEISSYERLEFIGDAVLGTVVAQELFIRGKGLSEGELTNMRSHLVRGENLTRVAKSLSLGSYLLMGRGEEATGGRNKSSNLEACFESIVGALFLDQGYALAREFVLRCMETDIEHIVAHGTRGDIKSELQEMLQKNGSMPEYHLIDSTGPVHDPTFTVEVIVDGKVVGVGTGKRKIDAERVAASEALSLIKHETRQ